MEQIEEVVSRASWRYNTAVEAAGLITLILASVLAVVYR
jgi:hypothetical protein